MHQTSAYRRSSPLSALPLSRTSSLLAVTRMPLSSLPIPRASRSNVRQHRALTVTNSSVRARWHFVRLNYQSLSNSFPFAFFLNLFFPLYHFAKSQDVKWGKKADAIQLLQEWVSTVGHDAGLTTANARITGTSTQSHHMNTQFVTTALSEAKDPFLNPSLHTLYAFNITHIINYAAGLLGAPESRLELEVEVESLAALEQFWGGISPAAHKAWSQRAAHCIIDGTPKYEPLFSKT